MKRALSFVNRIALGLVALSAALLFWPFAVGGFLVAGLSRKRVDQLVPTMIALVIAIGCRILTGEWQVQFGDRPPDRWYHELLPAVTSWSMGTIIVFFYAKLVVKFMEGYGSQSCGNQEAIP